MALIETLTLISGFKDELLKLGKYAKEEISFFVDNGLSDYLEKVSVKYSLTKTFLYRNENVEFYKVFFPVSIRLLSEKISTVKLNNDIQDLPTLFKLSRFVTIIGNAGSGKTMLMKHFFLNSISTQYRIPIVIELRNLNDFDGSITEYIYKVIFNNKLSPTQNILERVLTSGQFIFILDGYDEIHSTKKHKLTAELDDFIDKYTANNYIISSRPGSGIESFPRFNNYHVNPLTYDDIIRFIDQQFETSGNFELATKIKAVIQLPVNRDYLSFISNPLLLSMFIITFESYPELPKKKSKFYWNVFDTLAVKHDSFTKKGGYQHERKTGLQNEELETILQWFSYISLLEGEYSFDSQYLTNKLNIIKNKLRYTFNTQHLIEDFTLAIGIIVIDGTFYTFPHKSLQEYFCALLIKNQTEENKEKIYGIKFHEKAFLDVGNYENLWNLCYELDKNYFIKFFLLKQLEDIYIELSKMKPFELLKSFYERTLLNESFKFIDDTLSNDTGFGNKPDFKVQFLSYIVTPIIPLLVLRDKDLSNSKKLVELIKAYGTIHISPLAGTPYYNITYDEIPDNELEEALMQVGHVKGFYTTIQLIQDKINQLHNDIALDEQNQDFLLDLV